MTTIESVETLAMFVGAFSGLGWFFDRQLEKDRRWRARNTDLRVIDNKER